MEKLQIEYRFNIEDFKRIEDIEHSYFPDDNITPAEEVLNWYNKNDLTCIGVRNDRNEIIASVSILPLNKNTRYNTKIYCEDGERFFKVIDKIKRKV